MPTANLKLPYIETAQAQKEVTHANALNFLDWQVQTRLLSRVETDPPVSPSEGDLYLIAGSIPNGATGDWLGEEGKIAQYLGNIWRFRTPIPGMRAYVADEDSIVVFDGTTWRSLDEKTGVITLASSTVANLPGSPNDGGMIFVSDASGGAVPAFARGGQWRSVIDGAVIS